MFVIKREKPTKQPSEQTLKEQEFLNIRIKKNQDLYQTVTKCLEKVLDGSIHLKQATELAIRLGKQIGAVVDRRAKRHKPAIICWFCENWAKVYPLIVTNCQSPVTSTQQSKQDEQLFLKKDEALLDTAIQSSPDVEDSFDAAMFENHDPFWSFF